MLQATKQILVDNKQMIEELGVTNTKLGNMLFIHIFNNFAIFINVFNTQVIVLYVCRLVEKAITSDMGGSNVGMWRATGLNINDITPYVPHPCDSNSQLYFVADVSLLIQNMRNCFENQILLLPQNIVHKYSLFHAAKRT